MNANPKKGKNKYSKHPQKFNNPDPKLQKEWEELKEVLCDNEYMINYKIMIGQPINISTVWNILSTKHTDTTNIYSHLFFAIFFLIRCFFVEKKFIIVNSFCFLTYFLSATYHTFRNYSRKLYDICLIFDVSGIAIQIFGFLIMDSICFFQDSRPDLMKNYLIFFCTLFIIVLIAIPIILHYKIYCLRTFLFTLISLLCFPQVYHYYHYNGLNDLLKQYLPYRTLVFIWQGIGLCFRSSHVPERFLPGTIFQYFWHSHFWFHIFATFGSYYGCLSCEVF